MGDLEIVQSRCQIFTTEFMVAMLSRYIKMFCLKRLSVKFILTLFLVCFISFWSNHLNCTEVERESVQT